MLAAAYCDSFKSGAKIDFHAGRSGWARPPIMGGGGSHEQTGRQKQGLNAPRLDRRIASVNL